MRLFYHDYYMQDITKTRQFQHVKSNQQFITDKLKSLHSLQSTIFPDRKIAKVTQNSFTLIKLKVPVVRLYGITKRGQKACVNVFDVKLIHSNFMVVFPLSFL